MVTNGSPSVDGLWGEAPRIYAIAGDEVHVWHVDLHPSAHDLDALRGLLSPDERIRADRFIRAVHGQDFTTARGSLRCILAKYTGQAAQNIQFSYNDFGKPILPADSSPPLAFNVSHTGHHCVVAVCHHASVGIDIERYRSTLDVEKLAHRYFSPKEIEALMALPSDRREEAFYRCWSSKEAFMKVTGQGLSLGLSNFEVNVNPETKPAVLHVSAALGAPSLWESMELPMGDGVSGVLTVEGVLGAVHLYRYTA